MSEALTGGPQEAIAVPSYETVQADTKLAAIRVLSSTGGVEVTEALRGRQAEVLAIINHLAVSAGLQLVFGNPKEEQIQDRASLEGTVTDETDAGVENDPRLAAFKAQFEALPAKSRRNLSWVQVIKGMSQSVDMLLSNVAKLESAQVFEVDQNHNLVFCDGGDEVPNSTLDKNYFNNHRETKAAGLELFTEAEYRRLQTGKRKYDKEGVTWLESGDHPSSALDACCRRGKVSVRNDDMPGFSVPFRGARRLLRVKFHPVT